MGKRATGPAVMALFALAGCQGTFGDAPGERDDHRVVPELCLRDPDSFASGDMGKGCSSPFICGPEFKTCVKAAPFTDGGDCAIVGASVVCTFAEYPDDGGPAETSCELNSEGLVECTTPLVGLPSGHDYACVIAPYSAADHPDGPEDYAHTGTSIVCSDLEEWGWICALSTAPDAAVGEVVCSSPSSPGDDSDEQGDCHANWANVGDGLIHAACAYPDLGGDVPQNCERQQQGDLTLIVCAESFDAPHYPDFGGTGTTVCEFDEFGTRCRLIPNGPPQGSASVCTPGQIAACDGANYCNAGAMVCLQVGSEFVGGSPHPVGAWSTCYEQNNPFAQTRIPLNECFCDHQWPVPSVMRECCANPFDLTAIDPATGATRSSTNCLLSADEQVQLGIQGMTDPATIVARFAEVTPSICYQGRQPGDACGAGEHCDSGACQFSGSDYTSLCQ